MKLSEEQIAAVEALAWSAGQEILDVYNSADFDVEAKGDGSPLTKADKRSHVHIVAGLSQLTPDIPVLSEESAEHGYETRRDWSVFWLVDPLDGTKEFIKRNGEFTVNIALVIDGVPAFGVVQAPVLETSYTGGTGYGAWRTDSAGEKTTITATHYEGGSAVVVASRSHRGEAVDAFINKLTEKEGEPNVKSMGSSLKICLVAEGVADIYPRLGPTSEWDTAAAHAVVLGAGGSVTDTGGSPLQYNKEDILNPWFLVSGSSDYPWTDFA